MPPLYYIYIRMVRLTRDLIKKKSEHNEGIVGDLEEISLHQVKGFPPLSFNASI